jgi:type I restriction enzyme M protein
MNNKEINTDFWVKKLLEEADIEIEAQGSSIPEINNALKTASKNGKENNGYPEFVGVVNDFLIVIENKASLNKHIKQTNNIINTDPKSVTQYAVNGALFYGRHLLKNTTFKKAFIFGVSGNEKLHQITPIFIEDTQLYVELEEVESFILFNKKNIEEFYARKILKEEMPEEKEVAEILKDAAKLHEHLRNYSNLQDIEKPLIVSGILLALREKEFKNFSINNLIGDEIKTDGVKIYEAIESHLSRVNVNPPVKKQKVLNQFKLFTDTEILNAKNKTLKETPLKFFTKFIEENIYKAIKYTTSSEDYLGRFYGEFMSYSGGDGQSLGIVLTPKHVTDLFCDLVDIKVNDIVLDPCTGTGGFLIAAMHHMLKKAKNNTERDNIKERQLHGIESQSYMFTIATTNMILRGDGKSNIFNDDFIYTKDLTPQKLQQKSPTVGFMNPPYSQGSTINKDLYEISFIKQLLDSLVKKGRAAVIIPQSTLTGKTNIEKALKKYILDRHTLEGVITMNKDTFYGVGVSPCVAIFTAGIPHPKDKYSKFIDFKEDGYIVSPHIGLIETISAKDKKQHLLDVWKEKVETNNNFCIEAKVSYEDEWLHSYYYFNEEIPTENDFKSSLSEYLTFKFNMLINNKIRFIKENFNKENNCSIHDIYEWKSFVISNKVNKGVFDLNSSKSGINKNKLFFNGEKDTPYVTRSNINNGIDQFVPKIQETNHKIEKGNCITIGLDTQTIFYQSSDFHTGQNIQVLRNNNIDEDIALFLIPLLEKQLYKFNWGGNGATLGRLEKTKIILPVDVNGDIDWKFMKNYIRKLKKEKTDIFKNSFH